MEAATRPARLGSDLAAAAGSRLGSAKEPTITTHWRRPVRCQHHFSVLSVRPHGARARARIQVALFVLIDFDHFAEFSVTPLREPEIIGRWRVRTVTLLRGAEVIGRQRYPIRHADYAVIYLATWLTVVNPPSQQICALSGGSIRSKRYEVTS